MKLSTIVDIVTIIPIFFILDIHNAIDRGDKVVQDSNLSLKIKLLNISRVVRLLRVFRMVDRIYKPGDVVDKQIFIIFRTVVSLVIVVAGIL